MGHEAVYVSIRECGAVSGAAVVIDVLRAYTTAAFAFDLGVERILLSDDIDEALRLKASNPGSLALKDAEPVRGFDLSNSPVELQNVGDLVGRVLVQKTTAGTVGAVAAKAADPLYCAGFANAAATAAALREARVERVFYVVTGEAGAGDEDRSCAEYIAALVDDPSADVAPFLARAAASNAARILRTRVEHGIWGVHAQDVETCLVANRFAFVMRARDEGGLLTLRAYNQA